MSDTLIGYPPFLSLVPRLIVLRESQDIVKMRGWNGDQPRAEDEALPRQGALKRVGRTGTYSNCQKPADQPRRASRRRLATT